MLDGKKYLLAVRKIRKPEFCLSHSLPLSNDPLNKLVGQAHNFFLAVIK